MNGHWTHNHCFPKMQRLLEICEDFAIGRGLEWGLTKCHAIRANDAPEVQLYLDGEALKYSPSAEYLGVDIDSTGVTDAATIERLCKASARMRMLKAAGMARPRLSSARLQQVYGALIKPVWTYCIHLTPYTNRLERAAASFLTEVTKWLFPRLARHSEKRARRLLGLEDADIRRAIQLTGMCGRMEAASMEAHGGRDELEIEGTLQDAETAFWWALNAGTVEEPKLAQIQRWEQVEAERARIRRVAASVGIRVHPLWKLPTARHAACAANWPFGRFPENKAAVQWFLGGEQYAHLNERMRATFAKTNWDEGDFKTVTHCLERMTDFWSCPLRHRRRQEEMVRRRWAATQAARRSEGATG